jgi:TatD DNase family protein
VHLADTHAHLADAQFDADREAVLARARDAGVSLVVDVGFDLASSERCVSLAGSTTGVWAAVGVHPHDAGALDDEALARLGRLARESRVVAIGETGLDFHRDHSPRAAQHGAFEAHLALAAEVGKPALVHSRDAYPEVLAALARQQGRVRAVLHCYSGGTAALRQALDLGLYISLAGTVTYSRAEEVREVARLVPLDRLLIETDCPYLAPVPRRGRRNEPAYVVYVAQAVAEQRGLASEALAEATFQNAEGFLGLA